MSETNSNQIDNSAQSATEAANSSMKTLADKMAHEVPDTLKHPKYSRRIIVWSLGGCGVLFVLNQLSTDFLVVESAFKPIHVSPLVSILDQTSLYMIIFVFLTLVGSYVFGAAWDITQYKKFVTDSYTVLGKFVKGAVEHVALDNPEKEEGPPKRDTRID